ncbi:unnamed protein product [Penicillium nalgiovense]|uniref:Fungal lipase-type domain-containing protein n=1 Tax=Penicillium nalgiovense TaxID=60175 RepID=A0A1V6Z5J9_PENNA|nr:hypothetical protein PENNAL_c0003G07620 [Penicillium nalgiovense]CAG7948157.1 unnamed protein product [Penicillium nalgiovense]CAG7948564.1 unnamed protein product [Penicillium nalgiovense]CAG7949858.1 unnamed protein product [Penicillium nalgiovense]CAG7978529.1 unnamed protein product [Penicillium nalgiovense]
MLFDTRTVLAGVALVSQVFAAPLLEERASIDTSFWNPLQRAAQLSSAAYTGCTGKAFDITITKKLHDTLTDAQGYVGYSSEKKTIAVVMKGSTSLTDIINDISTNLVTPSFSGVDFPSGVKIMSGINRPWRAVHDDVISEVKSLIAKYPDYTLEATGHSLGGSLTYMSHVALAQNFPDKEITSYALAAFPIGNDAWANFAASQAKGTMYRGNNVADGVPNMYVRLPLNFKHYGTEIYSSGLRATTRKCDGQRDRACSAGNGMYGVTAGHFRSFGVGMGVAGCRSIL